MDDYTDDSLKQVNDLWMYGTGGNFVDFFITFTLNVGSWLGW